MTEDRLPLKNTGAKFRITLAKRDGRRSMMASLGGDAPTLASYPLRHPTLEMAKVELRRELDASQVQT